MPGFLRTTILSRYLFREIINYFVIFIVLTIVILMISQFYDMRNQFLQNSPPLLTYALFMLYSIPEELVQVVPLIALISTMFAYGLLAKNKEILAMVAAGLSFRRLAKPALLFGIFVTALLFWFNESVVPNASLNSQLIEQSLKNMPASSSLRRKDIMVKAMGNDFLFIERYLIDRREMIYPTVFQISRSGGTMLQRIEADRAVFASNDAGGSIWEFENAERWQFDESGTLRHYEKFKQPFSLKLGTDLDKFLSRAKDPAQMNYFELAAYVDLLNKVRGENSSRYSIALEQKLAFPFACLLLALLGYSVVADVHARRFAQGVFGGLLVTVIFYVCNAIFTSLAKGGAMSPLIASWLPLAGFVVLNYFLMLRLNRVRG